LLFIFSYLYTKSKPDGFGGAKVRKSGCKKWHTFLLCGSVDKMKNPGRKLPALMQKGMNILP
jgi:hypothetical protein